MRYFYLIIAGCALILFVCAGWWAAPIIFAALFLKARSAQAFLLLVALVYTIHALGFRVSS